MNEPPPASCFASPAAVQVIVGVVEQVRLARDTYRLRLASPELARTVIPGQFFMIRSPGVTVPLLGRPFALYDTWLDEGGNPAGIDVVYLVVGRMTGLMSTWSAGDRVEVWGPLGNGFPAVPAERLLLVAGGIGNTPFLAVARAALGLRGYGGAMAQKRADAITFCYGARSVEYLSGLDDFADVGVELRLATDDGSSGHHGFVTDLVADWLSRNPLDDGPRQHLRSPLPSGAAAAIFCCGPEVMMHAVAKLAAQHGVPCWLSLETPMACGFGACFSCVTKVAQEGGDWDYRRVCVEGPIFPAELLAF